MLMQLALTSKKKKNHTRSVWYASDLRLRKSNHTRSVWCVSTCASASLTTREACGIPTTCASASLTTCEACGGSLKKERAPAAAKQQTQGVSVASDWVRALVLHHPFDILPNRYFPIFKKIEK